MLLKLFPMKKITLFLISMILINTIYSQNCVNCSGGSSDSLTFSSILGIDNIATGLGAIAGGGECQALGNYSVAFGHDAIANNDFTYAFGRGLLTGAPNSVTIGNYLETWGSKSIVIGRGYDNENRLINLIPSSMMIGFISTAPTLFISSSDGTSWNMDRTGRVGIGNVTEPLAKLHIRADDDENAEIILESYAWNNSSKSTIFIGDTLHSIAASGMSGLIFHSSKNYLFGNGNIGLGVTEPRAKLNINGDLLFELNTNGIIMKSENGTCWKGTISNEGELIFENINCDTLTHVAKKVENLHSQVFVYPNPTKGKLIVEYTGPETDLRLEIRNISGTLLASYKIKQGENQIVLKKITDQMIIASVFTKNGVLISTNKILVSN